MLSKRLSTLPYSNCRRECVLLIAVIAAYANSFAGAFQFDDYNVIVNNAAVHSWTAWGSDMRHGIRPFLKFTYTLNWTSGPGLFGFHLFNLVVHGMNTIFVFCLSRRLSADSGHAPSETVVDIAFVTALLFALHPIQTEAVTYISSRSMSLMALFYMGSILAYICGRDNANRGYLLFILSPILFVLGLATKETAITLPAALLLWETAVAKKSLRSALKKQAVHWFIFAAVLLLFVFHQRYSSLLLFSLDLRGFRDNLLSQLYGTGYLLSRLLLITGLNIDPDLPTIRHWTNLLTLLAGFFALVFVIGISNLRRRSWLAFSILWCFLHLLSVSVFVPRIDIANERHFYLAGLGVFYIIGTLIVFLFSRQIKAGRYLWTAVIFLSIVLGGFTIARNSVYKSEITLWKDVISKSPNKARGYNNLGYAYALAGEKETAKYFYLKALRLDPGFTKAANNLSALEKKETD